VSDLVELTHVTLKLLEANTQATPIEKTKNDAVTRMKEIAADFDLSSYIVRKIISNQVVFMYTHLLSQYSINAPHVNHHIVAFFLRMSRLLVVSEDEHDSRGEFPQNPLAIKPATLEPMLYNIQLFVVLDQILNDATIRKEKEYSSLVAFSTSLMSRFASHAQTNQMAFVESLFRHPAPHRFCELSANMYVNEELRMIAERELLLEEHQREAASEGMGEDEVIMEKYRRPSTRNSLRQESPPVSNGAEDDEEVEWNDGDKEESEGPTSPQPNATNSEKSEDDPKEDEDDDERWSDRRAFVPKRKLLSDIDANAPSTVEKKQRIQKHVRDDSSEDEEEFEFDTAPANAPADVGGSKRTRLVIEDDED
jgi:timeless